MYYMVIVFDDEFFGWFDGVDFGYVVYIIVVQIKQYQVFGQFFLIGQQVCFVCFVLFGCGVMGVGVCNWVDCDLFVCDLYEDFRVGVDYLIVIKVEKEYIG